MLSLASKLLVAISATGAAMAVAYGFAVDERAGVILFVFLAAAGVIAAIALGGATVPDFAEPVPADAPPPIRHATSIAPPQRGSGWTAAAAAAVTLLAVGAAVTWEVAAVGAGAIVIATAGWFARVWSEHPSWTPRVRDRVSSRFLVPIGLPVASVLLALTIAFSLSRTLLAVSKNGATLAALVIGIVILGACAWVASRPRMASSGIVALAALATVSMAGMAVTGAVAGERDFPHEEEEHEPIKVVAHEVMFEESKITVAADEEVVIEFVNLDDVYHNVAVYQGEGPESKPIFNGEGFAGEDERTYRFEAPAVGTYTFVCDFHENMKGTFVVEQGE